MSRVILLAPREVECYLGERCYRHITFPKGFVVPKSLPRVIESKGALGMGKVGEAIDAYLVPDIDYFEWWTTQELLLLDNTVPEEWVPQPSVT